MLQIKQEKRMGRPSGWEGVIILNRVIRESFTGKGYLERPKGGEGVSQVKIWRKITTRKEIACAKIPGQGHA